MARKKAYDVGYEAATNGQPVKPRAYESDKANNAYRDGYVNGLRARFPDRPIVQCNRDFTIFAAISVNGIAWDHETDRMIPAAYIECPACGRRYQKMSDGSWESDRKLVIHSI